MRLLLDTHIVLWMMLDAPELKAAARRWIGAAESLHVSSVSLWELAIKRDIGKLQIDADAFDAHLLASGVQPLAIDWEHARRYRALPRLHRDPFDRMLVAQAIAEPMHLLTRDATLAQYSDLVICA